METLELLKYPNGKFSPPSDFTDAFKKQCIMHLVELPSLLKKEYDILKKGDRMENTYRPDGWSARQVIHHLADSHMNALIRFKLTLTENHPTIKPYLESRWATLKDVHALDPIISINMLEAIHAKLVCIIEGMKDDEFSRTYFHPESQKDFTLSTVLALYAWHGLHHLGHLRIINK